MVPLIAFSRSILRARAAVTTRAADFRVDGAGARARVGAALGLDPARFVRGEQVHGARVVAVAAPPDAALAGVDGLATRTADLALLALGADCPGVALLADEAVAVAHAGWRGAVGDIACVAAAQLAEWGATPREAWIGPGIGPCCFEVGDEVVAAFEEAHGPLGRLVSRGTNGKARIDLKGAIARRLVERSGLRPEEVHVLSDCTRCSPDRFFSRRGEGPASGHHAMVAWLAQD